MESKVSFIKLNKAVSSKLDLAKAVVSAFINFFNINLSATELNILAYFMVYGINNNCKELIVKANICKNTANINTIMVKLKKYKLIKKDELNGKNYVCDSLNFEMTPSVGLLIKIDNK